MALSFGTIAVDKAYNYRLIPRSISGSPDAAIAILSTVAGSMVSLAALVLTITMVVVQLAMGQFSPRIVQRILQDKPSQLAIGIFVATFAHAILALREVQTEGDGIVPGVAVLVAFILVVVSIMVLVWYVNHIGRALRVSALIELVGRDTRKLLEKLPSNENDIEGRDDWTIMAPHSGVITRLDHVKLIKLAKSGDCVLELQPHLGQFVPAGAKLFRVEGGDGTLDKAAAIGAVELGLERTLDQDMAYGLRLLVDIAERSLSEGRFQDPTTAVQSIDRLHDCLRQLAARALPDGRYQDSDGAVRLVMPTMSWNDYVHLAFDEIRMAGIGSPQIARRLRAALEDLITVTSDEQRAPLEAQLGLLDEGACGQACNGQDAQLVAGSDALGLG